MLDRNSAPRKISSLHDRDRPARTTCGGRRTIAHHRHGDCREAARARDKIPAGRRSIAAGSALRMRDVDARRASGGDVDGPGRPSSRTGRTARAAAGRPPVPAAGSPEAGLTALLVIRVPRQQPGIREKMPDATLILLAGSGAPFRRPATRDRLGEDRQVVEPWSMSDVVVAVARCAAGHLAGFCGLPVEAERSPSGSQQPRPGRLPRTRSTVVQQVDEGVEPLRHPGQRRAVSPTHRPTTSTAIRMARSARSVPRSGRT